MTASASTTPSPDPGIYCPLGSSAGAGDRLSLLYTWRPSAPLISWVLVLSVVRLCVGGLIPLTDDEAYYRLWAVYPSMGYYDHPPMVAWWIAFGRLCFGDTPFAVRFLPTVSTALVTFLVADIGRLLGYTRTISDRAGVWYNATFLIALGGEVCTPDAPATLFWTATIWAIARAWRFGGQGWWVLGGITAGLASLSKYSGLFIGPGAFLWLIHSPTRRKELLRPWPWAALVLGGLIFTPNLIWNAQHDWVSFNKQFSRVAASRFTPRHVIDFPATQFVLLNPIVASFAALGVWRAIKQEKPTRLLVLSIAPFFLFLVIHSFHAGVQAHWTAPLYPPLALLAAEAAGEATGWRARAARAAPWIGFGVAAVVLAHIALPSTDWFGRKDAVMILRGWPSLAAQLEERRIYSRAGWVGTFNYTTASKLLDQRKSSAPVVELNQRARFDFEPAPKPLVGPGLLIELSRRVVPSDLKACFERFIRLPDLHRGDRPNEGVAYSLYLVDRPKVDLLRVGCVLEQDREQ